MPHKMDRLLFGDNQFFGINHMSEEKARAGAMRFQDTAAIMAVLDAAYAEGVRTFMCTTHERVAEICDVVRAAPDKYPDFRFYPCMPYAHKYADAVTEDGYLGALRRFLPNDGLLNAMFRGGMSIAYKDVEGMITLLVDAEMKMFTGLQTPVIYFAECCCRFAAGAEIQGRVCDFRAPCSEALRCRTRIYHDEPADVARSIGAAGRRESDCLCQYEQDWLSDVRRA